MDNPGVLFIAKFLALCVFLFVAGTVAMEIWGIHYILTEKRMPFVSGSYAFETVSRPKQMKHIVGAGVLILVYLGIMYLAFCVLRYRPPGATDRP